jgi:hypothetical protein
MKRLIAMMGVVLAVTLLGVGYNSNAAEIAKIEAFTDVGEYVNHDLTVENFQFENPGINSLENKWDEVIRLSDIDFEAFLILDNTEVITLILRDNLDNIENRRTNSELDNRDNAVRYQTDYGEKMKTVVGALTDVAYQSDSFAHTMR